MHFYFPDEPLFVCCRENGPEFASKRRTGPLTSPQDILIPVEEERIHKDMKKKDMNESIIMSQNVVMV